VVAVSTSTAAITAIADGPTASVLGFASGAALNAGVAFAAFRVLTVADARGRQLVPGALLVGVCWAILQSLGGLIVDQRVRGASDLYGFFGVVIGLLGWIYLAAQVFLVDEELNVVRDRGLWPRRLFPPPLGAGDRQAITDEAREQALVPRSRSKPGSPTGPGVWAASIAGRPPPKSDEEDPMSRLEPSIELLRRRHVLGNEDPRPIPPAPAPDPSPDPGRPIPPAPQPPAPTPDPPVHPDDPPVPRARLTLGRR
jgi:hypothetical protein